jgi:hypothetical protein
MPSERNGLGDEASADDAPEQDPWFEPARRTAGSDASADGVSANGVSADGAPTDGAAASSAGTGSTNTGGPAAEWFLRTGRAGLFPDAVTISEDDDEAPPEWRHEAAGAPPWASDAVQADSEPPPWESGPWPGPGEDRLVPNGLGAGPRAGTARADPVGARQAPGQSWQARAALVTGVLPLVVPGIVLGVLGLRESRDNRSGTAFSLLGIALSVVWAVILGVVIFGSSGSTAGSCTVPSAVRASYGRVMNDLSGTNLSGAISNGTLATDAGKAAREANGSAATAHVVPLRGALAALAGDLEQVQADAPSQHATTLLKTLRLRLSTDGDALTTSCAG